MSIISQAPKILTLLNDLVSLDSSFNFVFPRSDPKLKVRKTKFWFYFTASTISVFPEDPRKSKKIVFHLIMELGSRMISLHISLLAQYHCRNYIGRTIKSEEILLNILSNLF